MAAAVAFRKPVLFPLVTHEFGNDHLEQTAGRKRKMSTEDYSSTNNKIQRLYDLIPKVGELFDVTGKVGSGTFSEVFLAQLRNYPEVKQKFALKHITPTSSPSRIERELTCLQKIGGADNVMGIHLCFREKDNVVFVMPYFPHDKFVDFMYDISLSEVKDYMKALLLALQRVHEFDIIHRDVKHTNFLYNRDTKQFSLVDFGLAQEAPVKLIEQNKGKSFFNVEPPPKQTSAARKTYHGPISPSLKAAINIKQKLFKHSEENSLGKAPPSPHKGTKTPRLTELKQNLIPRNPATAKFTHTSAHHFNLKPAVNLQRMVLQKSQQYKVGSQKIGQPSIAGMSPAKSLSTCDCFGKAQFCQVCMARPKQIAERAGTSGFRAPEVLLKSRHQTTAIDIWSAGVLFLSILSRHHPVLPCDSDLKCLAHVISLMGTKPVAQAAKALGKVLTCNPTVPSVNLKTFCQKVCAKSKPTFLSKKSKSQKLDDENLTQAHDKDIFPDEAYDLLARLLDVNPKTRITASEALKHPFLQSE